MAYKKLKFWFDEALAQFLGDKLIEVAPDFPTNQFVKFVKTKIETQELKDRVETFADGLQNSMKGNYSEKVNTLVQILGPENKEEVGMFANYYWVMPIAKFVEKYGLGEVEISLEAIGEITKRNTGEYAIRPFLIQYESITLKKMLE